MRAWLTEPSSSPRNPPRPREPTTTSRAFAEAASNAWWAAVCRCTSGRTTTPGYRSAMPARVSPTRSGTSGGGYPARTSSGGQARSAGHAYSAVTGTP